MLILLLCPHRAPVNIVITSFIILYNSKFLSSVLFYIFIEIVIKSLVLNTMTDEKYVYTEIVYQENK